MALYEGFCKLLQDNLGAGAEIIEGVQTEIFMFMIAIVAHTLVFGKRTYRKVPGLAGKITKSGSDRCGGEAAPQKANPKAAMAALKAAIGSSRLEDALGILRSVSQPWAASLGSSPTGGPRFVVRQLLRLAVEQSKIALLLDELSSCGLLGGWAAESLLEESSRQGSREAQEAILECVRARGVKLSSAAHCTLLRGARGTALAFRAMTDALEQHGDSEDVVSAAVEAALARHDASLADLAFSKLPAKPGARLASSALRLLGEGLVKDHGALQFFEERLVGVDLLHDAKAARLVADAALKAKRSDLLRELLATSSTGARQVSLMKSFGAEGRLKDAQELFKACPERTTCLHNALLDMYVDAGEMFAAERVMMSATKAGLADVITYNTIIKAHSRSGDIKRASCTIETMRSVGLAPNCVTFNELIDAAIKSDPQAVWGLIDEMKACGLQPNQVTCSILLKSVQRTTSFADVQHTLGLLDGMCEEMDEALVSSICEACIRSGQRDLLRQQLDRQKRGGGVNVQGAHTFGSIIRAHGFVQDLQGVWDAWTEMRNRNILPTSITLGCMVEALVTNDSPEAGYEFVKEMLKSTTTRPLVNAVIYSSVIKGFVHQKQFERAWEVYGQMQTDPQALQFSVATYNLLIDACARSCDMARVPGLLKEMSSQQIEPNVITFSTIVKGYVQEHQLDKAFDLLEDMKKGKRFKPDEITYNTLLDGCARHGLFERGIAVLEDMQDAGVSPSNFTLSLLVKLATRCRRHEKAFQLCADISKKYRFKLNVHVYNNLINTCIQSRDSNRAMDVFLQSLTERVRPDERTYTLLLRAAMSDEDAHATAGLLRAAHGLGGAHPALAGFDKSVLQLRGGLPADVTREAIEAVARLEAEGGLAARLVGELRRLPSVRLDSRLVLRLSSQAAR